jgi:hypothetical protein
MAKKYFTLVVKEPNGPWSPQFGDYERDTVVEEMADYKQHVGQGCSFEKGTKFKIVTTGETQAAIEAAVAKLNA